MKILVTGSSGTIGTRLCERLLDDGHTVIGLDKRPNKWQERVQDITIVADLLDPTVLDKVDTNVELVVHLAANARVHELVKEPHRAIDNFMSTFNVLEWARQHNIKRFIFASSRECYGNTRYDDYNEDVLDLDTCASPYAATKMGGEALVKSYTRCYGVDHIVFRFSNVYGMYDDSSRVVPLFIQQCKNNDQIIIYGKDKCLDFTYIDDAIDGITLAINKFDTVNNDTYNLACSKGTTILELAETLKEHFKSTSPIEIQETLTGEVTHYIANIEKARAKLGFDPKTPFEDGIQKSIEWYEAHPQAIEVEY